MKAKASVAATTAALLSSAASKLSSMAEDDDDTSDNYELDISSRGRLRKRRIIPNNIEDTGIKIRKNIPVHEGVTLSEFASTVEPVPVTVTSPPVAVPSAAQPSILQRQPGKPWPSHIISMLAAKSSNQNIRSQISKPSGQILRFVSPTTAGALRALQVPGKPNMIISPQNLSNVRFLSSKGVITVPRNRIMSVPPFSSSSSSSAAQTSHPVIQVRIKFPLSITFFLFVPS